MWTMHVGSFSIICENGKIFAIRINLLDSVGEIRVFVDFKQFITTARMSRIFRSMLVTPAYNHLECAL